MYQFNLSTKPLVPEYRVHAPTLVSSIFLVVTASAVLDIHSRVATLFRRSRCNSVQTRWASRASAQERYVGQQADGMPFRKTPIFDIIP